MKINKKNLAVEFCILFILVMGLSLVSAGYSIPYDSDTPLEVYPGEVKDMKITLLASPEQGNLTITVSIIDNGGIAELVSSNDYLVSVQSPKEVTVKLRIPDNAVIGSKYPFSVRLQQSATGGGNGMVGVSLSSSFELVANVIEKPVETPQEKIGVGWWILGIVVIIAVIVIIYFIVKSRRR